MTDRGNVIRQIERMKEDAYVSTVFGKTIDDVLSLLKKQGKVKPVLDEQTGRIWLCGNCGSYVGFEDNDPHDSNEFDTYCRECGTPVLWEGR